MLNAKRCCGVSSTKSCLDRGEHDVASVRIVWRGGAANESKSSAEGQCRWKTYAGNEMRDQALALARAGMYDDQIAAALTTEGHRSQTARPRSSQSPSRESDMPPGSQ